MLPLACRQKLTLPWTLAVESATDPGAGMSSVEQSQRYLVDSGAAPTSRGLNAPRDRWLRIPPESVMMRFPLAGQPGHGETANVRRQPVRIVKKTTGAGIEESFVYGIGHIVKLTDGKVSEIIEAR